MSPIQRHAILLTKAGLLLNGHQEQTLWNSNQNTTIFIQQHAFQNAVCEMTAILSRPQSVNLRTWCSCKLWYLFRGDNKECCLIWEPLICFGIALLRCPPKRRYSYTQVSKTWTSNYIPHYHWEVMTYLCFRYLLLALKPAYMYISTYSQIISKYLPLTITYWLVFQTLNMKLSYVLRLTSIRQITMPTVRVYVHSKFQRYFFTNIFLLVVTEINTYV